jgi:hypothetical protein
MYTQGWVTWNTPGFGPKGAYFTHFNAKSFAMGAKLDGVGQLSITLNNKMGEPVSIVSTVSYVDLSFIKGSQSRDYDSVHRNHHIPRLPDSDNVPSI